MTVKDLRIQYLRDTGESNQPDLVIAEHWDGDGRDEMLVYQNTLPINHGTHVWEVYPMEYVQWLEEKLMKAEKLLMGDIYTELSIFN